MPVAGDYSLNMENIKDIKIWNTHYQAHGDNWKVTIIYLNSRTAKTRQITSLTMTFAETAEYISVAMSAV